MEKFKISEIPPYYSCYGKYLGEFGSKKKLSKKALKKLFPTALPNDFVINIVERKSYNKKNNTITIKFRFFKFTKIDTDKWVWWEVK